ncbi:MAG TPA: SpoIID/LytB domain-containing protein [Smithellaceae bacterium]|nr:SpoIID/LytB domain-containing protein [Smithellaceae bacterium]
MIDSEPQILVALASRMTRAFPALKGVFRLPDGRPVSGELCASSNGQAVVLADAAGKPVAEGLEILLTPDDPRSSYFTVADVAIGIDFHWQRTESQSFRGDALLRADKDGTISVLNRIGLEAYLASVISSEMSAQAPPEFLKAQAVAARSWLCAMLEKKKTPRKASSCSEGEILRWQDVNDHEGFDVCADDHCQRYQGITKIISDNVARAVGATHGAFLVHQDTICDARYYKCCGGRTDVFATAWEDADFPYLASIADSDIPHPPMTSEDGWAAWLGSSPEAYCNTKDTDLLARVLPAFDLETLHFYRWRVAYDKDELEEILRRKSGIDFGELQHLKPLSRGPSGRIFKLQIVGTKRTVTVGKELEIRRWLSPTHLLSSAFVAATEHDPKGRLTRFILHGGGWGHGVGLCQIGAAVMAEKGFSSDKILAHYFPGAELRKLY